MLLFLPPKKNLLSNMSKSHLTRMGVCGSAHLKSSRLPEPWLMAGFPLLILTSLFITAYGISNKLLLHHSLWIHRAQGWTTQISSWKHCFFFLPYFFGDFFAHVSSVPSALVLCIYSVQFLWNFFSLNKAGYLVNIYLNTLKVSC